MELTTVWFILIAVLWTGYLVLEGFDFGVGMLLPALSRGEDAAEADARRRVMLTSIGPFWDGNEVWLITAGGATFAAFPHWYATMFSAMYLPLLLLLVVLILRIAGLEYRHKRHEAHWRRRWDIAITVASFVAPLLVGIALTNLVRGLPIDADFEFTGSLLTLLHPVSLLGGLTVVALCVTHGAFFLGLKTAGPIRADARVLGGRAGLVAAVLAIVTLLALGLDRGTVGGWVASAVSIGALVLALLANRADAEGWAFVGTAVAFVGLGAAYFFMLFPDVMPSTSNPDWSLTTENAASSPMTLKIMTIAMLVFLPITLIYTAWNYWVFRRRISTADLAAH